MPQTQPPEGQASIDWGSHHLLLRVCPCRGPHTSRFGTCECPTPRLIGTLGHKGTALGDR